MTQTWDPISLDECGHLYCGQSLTAADVNLDGRGYPYFTGPEQWDGRRLRIDKWSEHAKRVVPDGCIFITVKGAGVGTIFPGAAGAIGRDIYAFQVHEELNFKYVLYALRFTVDSIVGQAKGDIPGLSKNHILDHKIVLPGIVQQGRIVAKLEELFSELDKGVEALSAAREQLKAYQQSALKHAFEGKLTDEWRAANPARQSVIAAIRTERKDQRGKGGKRSRIYSDPDDRFLKLQVPATWTAEYLGNLNVDIFDGPFGSHLKTSDYVENGVRVIRLENIGYGHFIDEKRSFVSNDKYQGIKRHTVVPGDIVFSSFVTEAIRSALVPRNIAFALNKADCFGIRFLGAGLNPKFVQFFLQSRSAFKQVESMIHGVGRPRINTSQLKEVVVPVCAGEEQDLIVERLEFAFSESNALEAAIDIELSRLSSLRQAILRVAFSGQLVTQDSKDEPASAVLERIRAERESAGAKKERNSKNGKKKAA